MVESRCSRAWELLPSNENVGDAESVRGLSSMVKEVTIDSRISYWHRRAAVSSPFMTSRGKLLS